MRILSQFLIHIILYNCIINMHLYRLQTVKEIEQNIYCNLEPRSHLKQEKKTNLNKNKLWKTNKK